MQIIRKKYNWASPLFKRNKTNRIILHHAKAVVGELSGCAGEPD